MSTGGIGKARLAQKVANGKGLIEPLGPSTAPRFQREATTVEPVSVGDDDVEPLGRQFVACPIGPLDQRKPPFDGLREADLDQFVRISEAIEVKMMNRKASRFVALQQREGGAWHLEIRIAGKTTDDSPREGALAHAEIAVKGDDIPRTSNGGDVVGKAERTGFVGNADGAANGEAHRGAAHSAA